MDQGSVLSMVLAVSVPPATGPINMPITQSMVVYSVCPRSVLWLSRPVKRLPWSISIHSPSETFHPYWGLASGTQVVPDPILTIDSPRGSMGCIACISCCAGS